MNNYQKAVEIYHQSGQYAIYRACEDGSLDHDAWLRCVPCEDITPFSEEVCLVCETQGEIHGNK
jgi:hypothetical protein